MLIPINVKDKVATVSGAPVIVCGNSNYKLGLTFDAEWSDQAIKTARFVYVKDGEVKHIDVPFDGAEVDVPALIGVKEVYIGFFAGDLHTTTPARVPCSQSIRCMAAEPEEPTPSQYDQIIALLNAGIDSSSVKYIEQTLTDSQKAQARENIGAVPETRKVNGKPLTSDISLTPGDVGAVPTSRTVNGKALTSNITLSHSDVGAAPAYTYGTEDIEAGSESPHPTGTLHFVYE